ncbi:unnamed protein product [Amoebophrya sp. A120]|nr:unnamed protein product [Amoebophrya sp. A120]|eukprot:GSA120T00017802001.1
MRIFTTTSKDFTLRSFLVLLLSSLLSSRSNFFRSSATIDKFSFTRCWRLQVSSFLLLFVYATTLPLVLGNSYEYVVVGSGSAGSVVASRLAQHGFHTLLIEAGSAAEPLEKCEHFSNHAHQFQAWQYPTEFHDKRTFINNPKEWRQVLVHGKVAGGSSMLNSCLFTPAGLREFEHLGPKWNSTAFATAYQYLQKHLPVVHKKFRSGIYTEVILLKLIERGLFSMAGWEEDDGTADESSVVDHETRQKRTKLTSGSIKSRATHLLDHSGYRRGWWLTTDEDYTRRTSYDSLVTQKALPNLDVWLNATVTRVLFAPDGGRENNSEKRATGIEVQVGPHGLNKLRVYASREIVLSAGALGTPKILTLSGIADPYDLGRLGIPVTQASYAVGKYLKDHLCWVGYVMMEKHFGNRDDCDTGIMGSERLGIFLNITKEEDVDVGGFAAGTSSGEDEGSSNARTSSSSGSLSQVESGQNPDEPETEEQKAEKAEKRKQAMWENVLRYEAEASKDDASTLTYEEHGVIVPSRNNAEQPNGSSGKEIETSDVSLQTERNPSTVVEDLSRFTDAADQFAVEGELRLFSTCYEESELQKPGTPSAQVVAENSSNQDEEKKDKDSTTALHYTVEFVQMRPKTTGRVFVKSNRPEVPPTFEYPRIFPEDYDYLAQMGKWMGDQFASTGSTQPEPITEQAFSPGALESARATARLYQHPCCSAGVTRVLDQDLRVMGVKNLRVADASAWAEIPSSHLAAPTMALGYLAAEWMVHDAGGSRQSVFDEDKEEHLHELEISLESKILKSVILDATARMLQEDGLQELKQYLAVLFDGRMSVVDVRNDEELNNGLRLRDEILQRVANTVIAIFQQVKSIADRDRQMSLSREQINPAAGVEVDVPEITTAHLGLVRDAVLQQVFDSSFPDPNPEEKARVRDHKNVMKILLRARLVVGNKNEDSVLAQTEVVEDALPSTSAEEIDRSTSSDHSTRMVIDYPPSCPVPVVEIVTKYEKSALQELTEREENIPEGITSISRELLAGRNSKPEPEMVADKMLASFDDASKGSPKIQSEERDEVEQADVENAESVAPQSDASSSRATLVDFGGHILERTAVHKIAFGTGTMDDRYFLDTCVAFLRAGGRVLDTAHLYDNNEQIKTCIKHSQIPREEIVIVTKVMPLGRRETEKALSNAFETLGTEENFLYKKTFPLDYVLVHWPGNNKDRKLPIRVPADCAMTAEESENRSTNSQEFAGANTALPDEGSSGGGTPARNPPLMYGGIKGPEEEGAEDFFPGSTGTSAKRSLRPDSWRKCREETYATMIEWQNRGKVKKIGYSNFGIHHVNEFAMKFPDHPPQMHQMEMNPAYVDLPVVETHAVQNQYYSSINQPWNKCVIMAYGLIGGNNRGQLNLKHVDQIAKRNEIDRYAMLVKWIVDHLNGIVLVASRSTDRLKEALCLWKSYPNRLPETDMTYLTTVANNFFRKAYTPYPDDIG